MHACFDHPIELEIHCVFVSDIWGQNGLSHFYFELRSQGILKTVLPNFYINLKERIFNKDKTVNIDVVKDTSDVVHLFSFQLLYTRFFLFLYLYQ